MKFGLNKYDYGFKDISSNQLMVNFFRIPCVDLRVDFNSWIPRKLNQNISNKLANFYLSKFKKYYLHDKINLNNLYMLHCKYK